MVPDFTSTIEGAFKQAGCITDPYDCYKDIAERTRRIFNAIPRIGTAEWSEANSHALINDIALNLVLGDMEPGKEHTHFHAGSHINALALFALDKHRVGSRQAVLDLLYDCVVRKQITHRQMDDLRTSISLTLL